MIELDTYSDSDEHNAMLPENDNDSIHSLSLVPETNNNFCSLKCALIFFIISTLVMTGLWLSESQIGEGILRKKNVGENCAWRIGIDRKCAPPLICGRNNRCQLNQVRPLNCSEIDFPSCSPCPPPKPCPPCRNLVSYFDFNEFPNHWLGRQSWGKMKAVLGMSYGACKEICARDSTCKVACYNGISKVCYKRTSYTYPGVRNMSWTCAIKS